MRGHTTLILMLALHGSGSALAQSALQATAAGMSDDSWAVLATNGIDHTTLLSGGASGFITGDAHRACWDPIAQQVHFIGMDHEPYVYTRHIVYDAATSTWLRLTDPPWSNSGAGSFINHAWDQTACDVQGRAIYRFNHGS